MGVVLLMAMVVALTLVQWIGLMQVSTSGFEQKDQILYFINFWSAPVVILIHLLLAWGLWKLMDWARVVTIVFYGMVGLGTVCKVSRGSIGWNLEWIDIVRFGLAALVVGLLVWKDVASEFE